MHYNVDAANILCYDALTHPTSKIILSTRAVRMMTDMWATVPGIAGMAAMPGVRYDGNRDEMIARILVRSTYAWNTGY